MFRARRIMRRRAARNAATRSAGPDEQAPAVGEEAPASGAPIADLAEQLKELAELREQGILTEEEFSAEKKKLLGT
jgi:hypothetical protein